MTVVVAGFSEPRRDTLSAVIVGIAFWGLIPVAVAAVIFAIADRRIRSGGRTMSYAFAAWLVVAVCCLAGFAFGSS